MRRRTGKMIDETVLLNNRIICGDGAVSLHTTSVFEPVEDEKEIYNYKDMIFIIDYKRKESRIKTGNVRGLCDVLSGKPSLYSI